MDKNNYHLTFTTDIADAISSLFDTARAKKTVIGKQITVIHIDNDKVDFVAFKNSDILKLASKVLEEMSK